MKFFDNMMAAAESFALMPSVSTADEKRPKFDLQRIASEDEAIEPGEFIVPGPFLRDFDDNPTELYRFIQMKRWARVVEVVKKSPGDAKIWIFRTEEDGVGLRWRLLPLHAALILNAPDEVVEALLKAYPIGAKCKDDQGSLPVHIICKVGASQKVAEMLLTMFPKGATTEDKNGRNPAALLALFNPANKTKIMDSVQQRVNEDLEVKSALSALDRRGSFRREPAPSSDHASVEVPKDARLAVASSALTEDRDPPEATKPPRHPSSVPVAVQAPSKLLVELQEKHRDQLLVLKESMDMQNEVQQAGEEMILQSKLEDVHSSHLAEIQRLKEEAAKRYEQVRLEEAQKLDQKLIDLEAKHKAEMKKIQAAEQKTKQDEESKRIKDEMLFLKEKHEKEVDFIKRAAEREQAAARREEREYFEMRLEEFESKHKVVLDSIKAEALVDREKMRIAELQMFEEKVHLLQKQHKDEMQCVEERLSQERESLQADQRKMFDSKICEIQSQHQYDLKQFHVKLLTAQEAAREERTKVIDAKMKELELKHLEELAKVEKRSATTISGIEGTIASLKKELALANAKNVRESTGFNEQVKGLEIKMEKTNTKATNKVNLLERTIESLEKSLDEARQHSLFLEDHVHTLEERLNERQNKDKELEEKISKMQNRWMCFEM